MADNERFCNQCKRSHNKNRICIAGKNVEIAKTAEINVSEKLIIGDGTKILDHAKIEGRSVVLGRECFLHEYSWLGGGGCFEKGASLKVGDWLHLGRFAHINYADHVDIGNEVGIGHQSSIFTHGGYLPVDYGFPHIAAPTKIGNRVWLPHAWVNPGINIGNNVVVAAMSLVNKNLPDNCFAAGIPVEIKENYYDPNGFGNKKFWYIVNWLKKHDVYINGFNGFTEIIKIGTKNTIFNIRNRMIIGKSTKHTERAKDLLRRIGIRFPYSVEEGEYVEWK